MKCRPRARQHTQLKGYIASARRLAQELGIGGAETVLERAQAIVIVEEIKTAIQPRAAKA